MTNTVTITCHEWIEYHNLKSVVLIALDMIEKEPEMSADSLRAIFGVIKKEIKC